MRIPLEFFLLKVSDLGYSDPVQLDTVICRGGILNLGDKSYANAGVYLDTIVLDDDCVNIFQTNLNVVEPLHLDLSVVDLARGEGLGGGVVTANAQEGTGNYLFEWSTGEINQTANNLIGGDNYCVTITDTRAGCSIDTCFIMEFPSQIAATFINDTLDCSYDQTGEIKLEVTIGKPPYQVRLQGIDDPSFTKETIITENDTLFIINNIPAGNFNIFLSNNESIDNFQVEVVAPPEIMINTLEQIDATCFESCDAMLEIEVTGGTGSYDYTWNNNLNAQPIQTDLCAGEYIVVITDENNCVDSTKFLITEPDKSTVGFFNIEPARCFGEASGKATVNFNGAIERVLWDNGETTEVASNLLAGTHQVIVTNELGCESAATVEISQPDAPLIANIDILETIVLWEEIVMVH